MRFVNTKRFSPVIYENDVPHELDLYWHPSDSIPTNKKQFIEFWNDNNIVIDKQWWLRQRKRCLNGYRVENAISDGGEVFIEGINVIKLDNGDRFIPHLSLMIKGTTIEITGTHYFYLNFWKILREERILQRKIVGNPRFTDLSWENWWIRERMFKEKKDNLNAKCRQRGFSEEEACDLARDFLFYQDLQLAIVGGRSIYNENTMAMTKRGIFNLINTQFFKELKKDTPELISTKRTNCHIYSRTAKDNPQVLSGLTPYKVKLEEIGTMQKGLVKSLKGFIEPSLFVQGRKIGYITYIGTGGEMDDGVEDMEEMFYNPKQYNLLEFENIYEDNTETKIASFIPVWKFEVIDDDGNSLKSESIKKVDQEREESSPSDKFNKIILRPKKPSEIFNIQGGGFMGEAITQWCNETRAYIHNHKSAQVVQRGFLRWKNKKKPEEGVEWYPDNEKGIFYIAEHPELDDKGKTIIDLYNAATDSYDQDESKTSSSKLSCTIFKTYNTTKSYDENSFTNNFVAYYMDRPGLNEGGSDVAYENTALLCVYYSCYNLIEYSKLLIFDWYENNGFEGLLKARPDMAIANMVKKTEAINKYGYPAALIPHPLKMLRDWCANEDNIRKCPFPELLAAWARFRISKNYNCDITISTALNIVSMSNDREEMLYQLPILRESSKRYRFYKSMNGQLVTTYK